MKRKRLLLGGLLLVAAVLLIATFLGLYRPTPPRSVESQSATPSEAPTPQRDQVGREDPGIGTSSLPHAPTDRQER
jgi:hypothetical protein